MAPGLLAIPGNGSKAMEGTLSSACPTRDKLHQPPAADLAKVIVTIAYPASLQGGCECPHVTDEKAEANTWLWSDKLTGRGLECRYWAVTWDPNQQQGRDRAQLAGKEGL